MNRNAVTIAVAFAMLMVTLIPMWFTIHSWIHGYDLNVVVMVTGSIEILLVSIAWVVGTITMVEQAFKAACMVLKEAQRGK